MGIKQRGGKMHAEVVPNVKLDTLRGVVLKTVQKGAIVSTDELISYDLLSRDGYTHGTVKHGAKEYVYYDWQHGVLHHTNHVESFWRLFKKSVASTHIHVSPKYMNRYLSEFTFRANHREMKNAMFDLQIGAV
jgi:transposase-like protein